MEGFIAVAIDLLDTLDGEADREASGDERDTAWPENVGAGCRFPHIADFEDAEVDDADTGIDDLPHDGFDEGNHEHDYRNQSLPRFGVDQTAGELPSRLECKVLSKPFQEPFIDPLRTGDRRGGEIAQPHPPIVGMSIPLSGE
jgi:hypothetical protein